MKSLIVFFLQFQHFPLDPGALPNSSQDNWTVQQSSLVKKECPHLYTICWYCIGQELFLNIPVKKNNSCAQPREIILRLSTTPHHWQQQTEWQESNCEARAYSHMVRLLLLKRKKVKGDSSKKADFSVNLQ